MITLASIAIEPVGNLIIVSGIVGIAYSFWNYYKISNTKYEPNKTEAISSEIHKNVKVFFKSRHKFLALFVVLASALWFFYAKYTASMSGIVAFSLLLGAVSAAMASYFSSVMVAKTGSNIANETQKSYKKGFKTSFDMSTSVGLVNASAIVLGLFINVLILSLVYGLDKISDKSFDVFIGYVLGLSLTAAITRISSSIFSKSAEMAEDTTVENNEEITYKSIFNPSQSNNSVGRIIGNVGGLSIDIFEAFSIALVSAILLGTNIMSEKLPKTEMLAYLPLIIASIGILTSIVSSFFLRSSKYSSSNLAVKTSEAVGAFLLIISSFFAIKFLLPNEWSIKTSTESEVITKTYYSLGVFWTSLIGVAASVGISYITESFVGQKRHTSLEIAGQSMKRNEDNILSSTRMSLISIGAPIILFIGVGLFSYYMVDFYGIAIAAVSYFGNLALQHSFSSFATISTNSDSIAQKSYLDESTTDNARLLKSLGNKVESKFRMFVFLGASLAALSMFAAFIELAGIQTVSMTKPLFITALLFGALIPILLSSNTIGAIKRIKEKVLRETNKQFSETLCLKDANLIWQKYEGKLNYATDTERETVLKAKESIDNEACIRISSKYSFFESFIPLGVAIVVPILLAVFGGAEILASLFVGLACSSIILAAYSIMKGNLSESAKNIIEEGFVYKGELIEKDSDAYEIAITGKRLGNTLKDSIAPVVISIAKLAIIISIILLPLLNKKSPISKTIHIDRLSKVEYKIDSESYKQS